MNQGADALMPPPCESLLPGKPARLISLDILRGFFMFWLLTGDGFPDAFRKLGADGVWGFLARQLDHAPFEGFTFYDLIFPGFLFVMGVSLVLSLERARLAGGTPLAGKRMARRALGLMLVALFMHGGMNGIGNPGAYFGVLPRLAYCYVLSALLFLYCPSRVQWGAVVCILLAYWAWLCFVPLPTSGIVAVTEDANWCRYSEQFLPPFHETAEGIVSGIPAVTSCMLGVFAGRWLFSSPHPEPHKVLGLLLSGLGLLAIGYVWGFHFPIAKRIWSSSYVCVAGGYSLLSLGLLYYVFDVRAVSAVAAEPFVWIGLNPLLMYMILNTLDFNELGGRIVGGPIKAAVGPAGDLLVAVAGAALGVCLAGFLHRRRIYLRV